MSITPYIEEILSQPKVLTDALTLWNFEQLQEISENLHTGKYEKVVLTGMGASFYSLYPAWLSLLEGGISAIYIDTAELIHYTPLAITDKTLLWAVSQSGKTAEMLPLCDPTKYQPGCFIATVNDLTSPLAQRADLVMAIQAPVEKTTSTRTYINSLAINQGIAASLMGKSVEPIIIALQNTAQVLGEYLDGWQSEVESLEGKLGFPQYLVLLGRGASLSSAWMGALILQEAAKYPAWGFNSGEFRHGPVEMVDERLTVIMLEGDPKTMNLNLRLLKDLIAYGAKGFWLGSGTPEGVPCIKIPTVDWVGRPLMEIAALELLSIAFADQRGLEAGKFFRIGKITLAE